MLDTLIMTAVIPEFFAAVGKKEQFSIPLWGWILRRWGAVPIDRSDRVESIARLNAVEKSVSDGSSLLISPEGTRSGDGQLLPFKKGPFHVAVNTGTPIVPVAILGAFESKNRNDWRLKSGTIRVHFCDPLRPVMGGSAEVGCLSDRTRDALHSAMTAQPECSA